MWCIGFRLFLFCCFCSCLHLVSGEEAAVPVENTVISIKNINKVCSDEVYRNERLKTEYSRILLRYKKTSRISVAEARLQTYLELKNAIRLLTKEIVEAQGSQVQLLMMIDQIGKGRELLAQEIPYVLSNRSKVSRLGKNQQVMLTVLRRIDLGINRDIHQMPLPSSYVNQFGMQMRLVRAPKKPAFYISVLPLEWKSLPEAFPQELLSKGNGRFVTGIQYRQALTLCRMMQTEEEGFDYRLPTYDELKQVEKTGFSVPVAVWTQSPWTADWKEEECCKRFGITMLTVWDPLKVLKKRPTAAFFQELPSASYEGLGLVVVSSGKSGVFSRFRKVQEKMQKTVQMDEKSSAPEDQGRNEQ